MSSGDVAAQIVAIVASSMLEIMPLLGGVAAFSYIFGLLVTFVTDN